MSTNTDRFGMNSTQITDQDKTGMGSGATGMLDQTKDAIGSARDQASGMTDQATAKADAGMEKAAGGMDALASTLRDKTDSMGQGTAQTMATAAADKLESGAELLRSTSTDQLVADIENFVRTKPVESLLIAFGVGYFLSKTL